MSIRRTDQIRSKITINNFPIDFFLFRRHIFHEILLQEGAQSAGSLLKHVKNIKRSLLYKVLERLVDRGLVMQESKNGKAFFVPQPPETLIQLIEKQALEIQATKEALVSNLPQLKATYNLSTERPIIRFYEGVDGLRSLYEDKLNSG